MDNTYKLSQIMWSYKIFNFSFLMNILKFSKFGGFLYSCYLQLLSRSSEEVLNKSVKRR